MKTSTDFRGKTTAEAIEKATAELGLDRDDFSCEVIESPRQGFLGIGKSDAIVRVTYEIPDISKPSLSVPQTPKAVTLQAPRPVSQPIKQATPAPRTPAPQAAVHSTAPVSDVSPATPVSNVRKPITGTPAEKFLLDTLKIMGITAQLSAVIDEAENTIYIDISGANMGTVIGRRGETLDALQYLSTIVTNKTEDSRWRIVLDTENYRQKRVGSLISLANKTASNVLKYGKSVALEPMNPQERRIIHAALQDNKLISTYSTGVEPRRKVIVALAGDDKRPKRPPQANNSIKKK